MITRSARLILAAAALSAAVPTAASAQDLTTVDGQTVITTITAAQMIGVLQSQGYEADLELLDDGTPFVASTYDGYYFDVYLQGCDNSKARRCESLQYYIWFNLDKRPSSDVANAYNNAWMFGKARILNDGTAVVEHAVDLYGGVTVDYLIGTVGLWETIVDNFVEHLNTLN